MHSAERMAEGRGADGKILCPDAPTTLEQLKVLQVSLDERVLQHEEVHTVSFEEQTNYH